MKKVFLLCCVCVAASFSAFSQITYLADTAFTTDVGYGGAPASCVYTGGMTDGWTMNMLAGYWLADSFTVPADTTWVFDTVIVFGVQRYSGTTSTYDSGYLQIFNADPVLGGTAIWGDGITNLLTSTGFTGIYRVDTIASEGGITGNERPVMYLKLHLSPAPVLTAGTYWLSWSAIGLLSDTGTTGCPPKVLPGRINPPNQAGRQLRSGAWAVVTDHGQNAGFNKIIKTSAAALTALTAPNVANLSNTFLAQNTPNPFNETTGISFYTPQPGYAKLVAYNTLGQLVATLFEGVTNAGTNQAVFNAGRLPAGVYYYQLITNSVTETKQMLFVK